MADRISRGSRGGQGSQDLRWIPKGSKSEEVVEKEYHGEVQQHGVLPLPEKKAAARSRESKKGQGKQGGGWALKQSQKDWSAQQSVDENKPPGSLSRGELLAHSAVGGRQKPRELVGFRTLLLDSGSWGAGAAKKKNRGLR